jgi:hypothetical protein
MFKDKVQMADACDATVMRNAGQEEDQSLDGYYVVECFNADGTFKWKDLSARGQDAHEGLDPI